MSSEPVRIAESVKFGEGYELDVRAYELRRAGRPLKLERIPMELLVLLVEMRGQLVTRDQIIERVWGKDVFFDSDNSINSAIRKIRQVLKDDPDRPRFLVTVTGKGYRFVGSVEGAGPPPGPSPADPPAPTAPVAEIVGRGTDGFLGKKISHYRILQMLGGGGMGVVYKAEDLKLGRLVAMKFLPSEVGNDPAAFERLQREARAASALDHPNICSVYELGEHEGRPFIVMQLLEGQTLREWIEKAAGDSSTRLPQLLELAMQILEGLGVAHEKGVIHRDIKPANIFITARGQAKILDFGVAKVMHAALSQEAETSAEVAAKAESTSATTADPRSTRTGASIGTPSYLSPEQIRGEKLDARTDLFSFGLVLYEMATGQRAFSGSTVTVVRDAVLSSSPLPPRQLVRSIPGDLETVINRSLEKDRERRYQSADQMRSDLQKLSSCLHPAAAKSRSVVALVSAAVVVVLLFAYALNLRGIRQLFHRREHEPSSTQVKTRPSIAVLGFKNLSGKEDEAWIGTAVSEMLNAELASGQQMRVVSGENVARMKLDLSLPTADSYAPDTLSKIQNHLNTDMVVIGSYLALGKESGGKVRIDLQLQDTRAGETIVAISRDGTESDLATLVSQSGNSLRQNLRIGEVSADDVHQVFASVPSNPNAARLYAEGLAKLQTFDALAARDLLEKAIAADPNHALSHAALAESWFALGYDARAQEEAKKAFDLSAKLSREDRLSIEGRYREFSHDLPAAIEIYRTLYNFFPDNIDYGLRLANAQGSAAQTKDGLATISRIRNSHPSQAADARVDLAEAFIAQQISDFKTQQQVAATAYAKAREQDAALMMASALLEEGWAWDHMGEGQKAMAALAEAATLSQGKNPRTAAKAHLYTGHVLYDKGDFVSANRSYEEALKEYREVGDQVGTSRSLEAIANVFYELRRLDEAKRYYEEELRINRNIGRKQGIAAALTGLGNLLEEMGDLPGAAHTDQQAMEAFREFGNKRGESTANGNWGVVLLEQGYLDAAKSKTEEAIKLQRETGYKRGLGFSLSSMAEIFRLQDQLDEAYKAEEQVITLRKEIGDESNGTRSQTQLAQIMVDQGRWIDAQALAQASAGTSNKLKMSDNEAQSNAILAEALLAEGKIKDAQAAADHAVDLSQKADRGIRFVCIIARADAKAASGKLADATADLQQVLTEANRYGYIAPDLETRLRLGQLEIRSGKSGEGRARLQQLQKDARNKGFHLIARKANDTLTLQARR